MYGRNHEKRDPLKQSSTFFDYSFEENGKLDIGAEIKYALRVSK